MPPLTLIHVETCETRSEARKLEKFLSQDTEERLLRKLLNRCCPGGEMVYAQS